MAPDTGNTESDTPAVTRGRQRPGAACDECRRRKLRCDGQHPQCSVCRDTDVVCEVTQRGVRGPKKGYLKALKNRIVHLEAMLESHLPSHQQPNLLRNSRNNNDRTVGTDSASPVDQNAVHAPDPWLPTRAASSDSEHEAFISSAYDLQPNPATLPINPRNHAWSFASALPATNMPPSEILQAELYRRSPRIPSWYGRVQGG